MLKVFLILIAVFCGQVFPSTFQATFFRDADAALRAAGIPDYLLPSKRFEAEELVRMLRLDGLMTTKWQWLPFHFQVDFDNHKMFPSDPVMQLALFLFPSPNNMFLPNQAISDPISSIDFRKIGLLAAGSDLRNTVDAVPDADVLYRSMMLESIIKRYQEAVAQDINEETPVAISGIFKSATPYTDFVRFYNPNLLQQQGAITPFLLEGDLEKFANMPKLDEARRNTLLQSFYKLVRDADAAVNASGYPDNSVAQMFLTFAFLKAKTPSDLTAFYNGLRVTDTFATAAVVPFAADMFTNTVDMYREYQEFMTRPDQVNAFKALSPDQRGLIVTATQLFDISYLPVINMESATYRPTGGRRNAPITFPDCVETAARNCLLALIRQLDTALGVVYDENLLPPTAKQELKDFVKTYNNFAAQTGEDARTEWAALVSKISGTRYMKPATKPDELERSCEIRAGHKNVLNILARLLGIDLGITSASDEVDILSAYTRICSTFSRDGFQVTCKVCDDSELERHSKIGDFFGKLEFQVNGKPMLTFNMETMHGETKACDSATAPKFLTDLLEQEEPENFVVLAGTNTLVRMVNKDNVVQMFGKLSAEHQREFLMLLPDEADVLVPLIDNFNKHTSAYTGSMCHKMLTQRVLQLNDPRADQLLFATFANGIIPLPIQDVVLEYPVNICRAPDNRTDNSLLTKALMHNPWQAWIDRVIERAYSINCVDYKGRAVVTQTQVTVVDKMLGILPSCRNLMSLDVDIHAERQAGKFFEWLRNSRIHSLSLTLPSNALADFVEHVPSALKSLHMNYDSFSLRYSLADLNELAARGQEIVGIAVGGFKPYSSMTAVSEQNSRAIDFAVQFCARHPNVDLSLGIGGDVFNKDLVEAFKQRQLDYRKLNSHDSSLQEEFAIAYQAAGIVLRVQQEEDVVSAAAATHA